MTAVEHQSLEVQVREVRARDWTLGQYALCFFLQNLTDYETGENEFLLLIMNIFSMTTTSPMMY